MKILYGVVGEGMGHAMRSSVVIEHLLSEGHDIHVMASSRAVDYLQQRFDNVHMIAGLHIIYEQNRVRLGKTVWSNVLAGTEALPDQIQAYFDLVSGFEPEAVVSDFESWTYLFGRLHGLPVVSIDNMQIINRCWHPDAVVAADLPDFEITKAFVKSKLPDCDHYYVTTFFYPEVRKERTSLHPPILRKVVLDAVPERGDHLLVYQTAEGNDDLAAALAATGLECRIYGMRRDLTADATEGRLVYRPFSERTFIDDLRTARAAIAGGGFTLMGECVYLRKPMLSVPVGAQFEQILNARWLEALGYGRHASALGRDSIAAFVEGIPDMEARLSSYRQDGNKSLFTALDAHLDRLSAGV